MNHDPEGRANRQQATEGPPSLTMKPDMSQEALMIEGDGPIEGDVLKAYMRAALRFLQAAVLMESAQTGNKELLFDIYRNAASLFQLCAAAYEHSSNLAAAVLAYKCMGAANMWFVHAKRSCILRDADALQLLREKNPSGKLVIPADLCPSYEQVMQYVDDTDAATESLRKAQHLFMIFKETRENPSLGAFMGDKDLVSLKNVLDFDLHHVGGLIQLVIEAMEVIGQ